mgnify:FL=1
MNLKEFKSPPKEYRASPFWAWNDQLDPDELRRQVRELKQQCFGGFFMHARVGLKTGYLSQEWFSCVAAVVEEAERQGMEAWLYDEDRWPSGCAGGLVTAANDTFKARWLVMRPAALAEIGTLLSDPDVVALFRLVLDDEGRLIDTERIQSPSQLDGQYAADPRVSYWQFRMEFQNPTTNSNGHGYIDVLNPEAVAEFIRVTHEQYYQHVGGHFGSTIPGVFADEPTYRSKAEDSIPWSPLLPGYFRSEHGCDLIDHLPLLFFEGGCSAKIRYSFYRTLTKAFVSCFTKQIYDWCEGRGLQFTGHYLSEDTLVKQTNAIGAAMPHYRYMHAPGIDHLGNNIADSLTLKQCASVGNQFGRKRLLCEIFGVSGHAMTFEDQKWIANFHFALGITFLSQHLVLYSMTGDRKRDYPPTFSYHQPYWPYYHKINDYLARAGYFCSQGDYICDTLVLHPIGSVWATFARQKGKPLSSKYDAGLFRLQDSLFKSHIPFDYGDELIMEDCARVIEEEGHTFLQVGNGKYSTVIVPPSLTWSRSTYGLLKAFASKGGRLLFVGERPSLIDGEPGAGEWEELWQEQSVALVAENDPQSTAVLKQFCRRPVVISGSEDGHILFQARRGEGCLYLFITNTSREAAHTLTLTVPIKGRVYRCCFETGEIAEVQPREKRDHLELELVLAPAGAHGYIVAEAELEMGCSGWKHSAAELRIPAAGVEVVPLSSQWQFERVHKNSITLDYCRYMIESSACGESGQAGWSGRMPIWQARRRLWHAAGLDCCQGIQPWAVLPHKEQFQTLPVRLQFEFYADYLPGDLGVVIENSRHWQLKVNGVEISTQTDKFHWDKQFGLVDIAKAARRGRNLIELAGGFTYGVEIEEIYLVGDFALRQCGYQEYRLVQEPRLLTDGSWVYQGYPFYAGNMVYAQEFDLREAGGSRVWIRLNQPKGTLFRVKVNNGEWKCLISQPWEVEITGDCVPGKNLLQIEVVGSLRNTFGPLHHRLRSPAWCGPKQFEDESSWVGNYQFEDYGLIGGAELVAAR